MNTVAFRKILFVYDDKITAQNYVVTLDDGNKVVVTLCDLAYEIPEKGRVRLPIGELKKYTSVSNEDKYLDLGVSKKYSTYRMDCYSSLRVLDEISKAKSAATTRAVIIITATFAVASVILVVSSRRSRKQAAE